MKTYDQPVRATHMEFARQGIRGQTLLTRHVRDAIRRTLSAMGLLGTIRKIRRARVVSNNVHMDEDFLQFAFNNDGEAIVTAMAAALAREPGPVRLIGSPASTDYLCSGLQQRGYQIDRCVWSYAEALPTGGLGQGILCEIPKGYDDWAKCAALTADGRIRPIWRLVFPLSLLRETLSKYEYNAATFQDLLMVYRGRAQGGVGRRVNQHIDRIEQYFPLRGRSIIEFGPSDGNHTADLLASGAAHVVAVEGRPENVIKLLVAKYAMGWQNLDVAMDNFQSPGSWAERRYDLVYAQGVYYHCQNPLIFLDMLTRLGDVIFIGGWVATDDKPVGPWIALEHDGAAFRGKAYVESHHFLSGLARQSYMLGRADIERFLARRGFVTKYCDITFDKNGLSAEFVRLLAMKTSEPDQATAVA